MAEEYFGEPISVYTSKQATEDGFLLNLSVLPLKPKDGIFSHVTTNLLYKCGYMKRYDPDAICSHGVRQKLCVWCGEDKRDKINLVNLLDLLNQAAQIIRRAEKQDWFYSGSIELPSGTRQKIFIAQNETGKFTLMLPEDY